MGKRFTFLLLVLGAGLALVQPCGGASGGFENTGSLAFARADHTATLLPNGKVLIVGGTHTEAGANTAELYDPAGGTWTGTASTTNYRIGHTATLLPNGKVLIAGSGNALFSDKSAELYDPASETWTATGSLTAIFGRGGHTATLLPNGKVLVVGGFAVPISSHYSENSAELYDPITGTWTTTGSLATARAYHTATLLPNGQVLVAGGENILYNNGEETLASAELYDPATGMWTSTGSLATPRSWHTMTLLPSGKVLVTGGATYSPYGVFSSAELYDPASGTWRSTGSLATARYRHTATLLPGGKVLVVGGYNYNAVDIADAELYNVASESWASTGSLVTSRFGHTATLLSDNTVLVAAGDQSGSYTGLTSAELYITPPILFNLSTRLRVETGDNAMIGGFIITGNVSKKVIIRAIGPSLTAFGVPGALSDPTLELHDSSGATVHNDDWQTTVISDFITDQSGEIRDSGLAPRDPQESAMIVYLLPGPYTAVVRGKNDGTGVALVEAYDLDPAATSKLENISTRGFVDTGNNVMIAGVIVGPTEATDGNFLIRAIGPSLSNFAIQNPLGNPTLELHDGSGTMIASNDNWKTRPDGTSQQAEIEATGIPPTNDLESALVQTLPAGNYTAIVRGVNGTAGVGLIEVYNLQ